MVNLERFSESEIPYDKLARFGLTQEMIDDLPQVIMQRLLASRETPMLPIVTENQNGNKVLSEARIALVRIDDGTVGVAFSPKWETSDLSEFQESQQRTLLAGKVILVDVKDKGACFVLYDDTIQQAMTVPVGVIRHNISLLGNDLGRSIRQCEDIAKGKVIQIADERGNITSVGVDLQEMLGLRSADGDTLAWQQEAMADKLPPYSFGIYGCCQTSC